MQKYCYLIQGAYLQSGLGTSADRSWYWIWAVPRQVRKNQSICTECRGGYHSQHDCLSCWN